MNEQKGQAGSTKTLERALERRKKANDNGDQLKRKYNFALL